MEYDLLARISESSRVSLFPLEQWKGTFTQGESLFDAIRKKKSVENLAIMSKDFAVHSDFTLHRGLLVKIHLGPGCPCGTYNFNELIPVEYKKKKDDSMHCAVPYENVSLILPSPGDTGISIEELLEVFKSLD